jgi:Arc/MetJ-type ribon-helix-helix transcriptional regulator
MVRDLVDRGYGKNRSDIVRQAIEFYYHSKDNAQA